MVKSHYYEGVCNYCDCGPASSALEQSLLDAAKMTGGADPATALAESDVSASASTVDVLRKTKPYNGLSICSGCNVVYYCSRECQVGDHPEHKGFCKAVRANAENMHRSTHPNMRDYYQKRHQLLTRLAQTMKRNFSPLEMHATVYQRVCDCCARREPPTALAPCEQCRMIWYCKDNETCREVVMAKHTKESCEANQTQFGCSLLRKHHWAAPLSPPDLPSPPLVTAVGTDSEAAAAGPFNAMNWDRYFEWRGLPATLNPAVKATMSDVLSVPLTIMCGLERALGADLYSRKEIGIHLLGACMYELNNLAKYEEIMHMLPALRTLNIVLVGPDLPVPDADDTYANGRDVICDKCKENGRRLTIGYFSGVYHEAPFAKTAPPRLPDLCIAFSSGAHEQEQTKSWSPTFKFLVENKVFTVFTSYTEDECTDDMEVLDDHQSHFVYEAEPNPFATLLPVRDCGGDMPRSSYFHVNAYSFAIKGEHGSSNDDEDSDEHQ